MDVMLYVFALPSLKSEFGLTNAEAGAVMAGTMVASAFGGIGAGILADRIGRRRTLILTILVYSFASAGTATAGGLPALIFWRILVGLGLGGEWSAGAVLVAESWPAESRGKAIGFMQSGFAVGYMIAAALSALIIPRYGWRVLFLAGVAPALLTVLIRRKVQEPEVWKKQSAPAAFLDLFRGSLARTTFAATALATAVLFGYWGLFTWLPAFLSAPAAEGGAGFTLTGSSAWMIAVQCGSLAGYWSFGILADRIGRRPAFLFYVLGAAAIIPVYGLWPRFWIGPLVGFFGTGYFSLFGAMLAELYPTTIRATGQGFTYNFGRALAALAPYTVGAVADRSGLRAGLALNSLFFVAAALISFALPETRGKRLD